MVSIVVLNSGDGIFKYSRRVGRDADGSGPEGQGEARHGTARQGNYRSLKMAAVVFRWPGSAGPEAARRGKARHGFFILG